MSNKTKTFAKGGIATAAVGAMALAGATPAQARDRDDGISVGDVIAGAVIIGGIAAVASAASKDRDDGKQETAPRESNGAMSTARQGHRVAPDCGPRKRWRLGG